MYEMYPEVWSLGVVPDRTSTTGDRPRRRPRKEHSVVPTVIVHRIERRA